MSDYIDLLKACIEDAPHDSDVEALLRSIVRKVVDRAKPDQLAEFGAVVLRLNAAERRALAARN